MDVLDTIWPTLEHILELNISQIFRAGNVPKTEEAIFNKFLLFCNIPVAAIARCCGGAQPNFRESCQKIGQCPPLHGDLAFLDDYFEELRTGDELLVHLDELQNAGISHARRDCPRFGLLKQFQEILPKYLPRMVTKYIRLSRQFNILF